MAIEKHNSSGRLTSYLWLVSIISIIILFFGILYYLETEKKGHYFDQLYFRQMEEISRGFESKLVRLSSFTRATQNFISEKWGEDEEILKEIEEGREQKQENKSGETGASIGDLPKHLADEFSQTKGELVYFHGTSVKDRLVEIFVEIMVDEDSVFAASNTTKLKTLLSCNDKEMKNEDYAEKESHKTYCKVLTDSVKVFENLQVYANLDPGDVRKHIIKSVKQQIDNLLKIQKLAKVHKVDGTIEVDGNKVGSKLTDLTSELAYGLETVINDLEPFLNVAEKVYVFNNLKLKDTKDEREKYLAYPGNVDAAARRHGLGLTLKTVDCTMEGNICGKTGLFIDSSGETNPYPVSNLIASSYVSEGRIVTAPMENLLPKEMGQFSAVLIASESGKVIIQTDSLSGSGDQHFLGINDLLIKANKSLLENNKNSKVDAKVTACEKENNYCKLEHSAFVDETIGGIDYRLYIRPHSVGQISMSFKSKPQSTLYFVGIKPLSELNASKFKISPNSTMALFFIVVAILLALVFLKIRLANIHASFTQNEGLVSVLVVIVFTTFSTIGITTFAVMEKLNHDIKEDANESIRLIQKQFKNEIFTYLKFVDILLSDDQVINALVIKDDSPKPPGMAQINQKQKEGLISYNVKGSNISNKFKQLNDPVAFLTNNRPEVNNINKEMNVSPIENLFMLNEKGRVTGQLIRGTKNLIASPPKDLSARRYFKRAYAGDVWEINVKCDPQQLLTLCGGMQSENVIFPVYIERIFNILDGARNTQFAVPVRHQTQRANSSDGSPKIFDAADIYGYSSKVSKDSSKASKDNLLAPKVISFGLSLQAFKAPILPSGLQYAVIENSTGQVLYHSNDNRSLIENFLQETENNAHLQALIRTSKIPSNTAKNEQQYAEPFHGLYRGENAVFFAEKLHKDIPWSLVVFKVSDDEQLFATLSFTVSIIIVLATLIIILFFVYLLMLVKRRPFKFNLENNQLLEWLWPQMNKSHSYTVSSLVAFFLLLPLLYVLLSLADNILILISLISVIVLIIIVALHRYIVKSRPATGNKIISLGSFRRSYIWFILSILLLTVAMPSLVITEYVGKQLRQGVSINNVIKINEKIERAQVEIDSRIARLCGKMANERQDYSGCLDEIGESMLMQLKVYLFMITDKNCNNVDRPIFCLTQHKPLEDDTAFGIYPLLQWLNPIWDLPVLLETMHQNTDPGVRIKFDNRSYYYLNHYYPNFAGLIIGSPGIVLKSPFIMFLVMVSMFIAYMAINFLSVRLLGINVPRSYRSHHCRLDSHQWNKFINGELDSPLKYKFTYIESIKHLKGDSPCYSILIRPITDNFSELLNDSDNQVVIGTGASPIDANQLASREDYRVQLVNNLSKANGIKVILLLNNIESIAFNKKKRMIILELLEAQLTTDNGISILITCDVAPLYMLTHQSQYISGSMSDEFADAQEVMRWSRLLSKFNKYYDWSPMECEFNDTDAINNLVLRELSAWPELYSLKTGVDELISSGKSGECILQYISTHAGSIYRHRWSFCTKEEKLMLYQLSKGMMINPLNIEPLEHLMRRGFIRRDPNWSIVNHSFARFVLTAESEPIYSKWVTASERGLWKILRVPLFTSALVILGILMYSSQEATESFLALSASVLALLPLLLRSVSLVKTSPSAPPDN